MEAHNMLNNYKIYTIKMLLKHCMPSKDLSRLNGETQPAES